MNLRPYQSDTIDRVSEIVAQGGNPVAVMPTGTGKTYTAIQYCERRHEATGQPVLWVAPSEETVFQPAAAFESLGWHVQIDKAEHRAHPRQLGLLCGKRVIVASQQSLARPERLGRYAREGWTLVVDEAHHSPAPTWLAILDHFRGPWLALTATPQRRGMAELWQPVTPFAGGLMQAIQAGWLVAPVFRHVILPESVRDCLTEREPREVGRGLPRPLVTIQQQLEGMQGLAFWPSVAAARQAAKWLKSAGEIPTAHVNGKTPEAERTLAIRRFRAGGVRLLSLCGVGIEGVDLPAAAALFIFRSTSELQLAQMVGRVLRTAKDADVDAYSTAEERRVAIAASSKPAALVVTCSSPESCDEALEPPTLLWGDLPEARLVEYRAVATSRDLDLDSADRLLRALSRDEQEARRIEREKAAYDALCKYLHPRRRALAEAEALQTLSPAERRAHRLRGTWATWRARAAKDTTSKRCSLAQAALVAQRVRSYVGENADIARITAEVSGWPAAVARSAIAHLGHKTGR